MYIERSAMAYMAGIKLEGRLNSKKGGLFGAIGCSLVTDESMFITRAQAVEHEAILGIAPSIPGQIVVLPVGAQQYCLNTSAFLACTEDVTYEVIRQGLAKALFGGTGGLFLTGASRHCKPWDVFKTVPSEC